MFIQFGFKDLIDILLVALLLYYCFRLMQKSRSLNLFFGVLTFIVVWVLVAQFWEMKLMGSLMDKIISVGAIALIVLFQDDIRNFFRGLGTHEHLRGIFNMFTHKKAGPTHEEIMPIVLACLSMSRQRVGALIVVERALPLGDFIRSGELIEARISQRLIENIFFKNSPLHDGAMIISAGRIVAAGCVLPVSHDMSMPKELGLRHRAAKGVSEETDALVIVVSEETGGISVAHSGEMRLRVSAEELEKMLTGEQ